MPSILAKLKELKSEKKEVEVDIDNRYMHPTVLECNLVRIGCDEFTIKDALSEPPERWEGILNYFEVENVRRTTPNESHRMA